VGIVLYRWSEQHSNLRGALAYVSPENPLLFAPSAGFSVLPGQQNGPHHAP
jgi:hypothetical protein